jgi:hypothetical protein
MQKQPQNRRLNKGISLFNMIFVAMVVATIGLLAVQIFPTVTEYLAIKNTIQRASYLETPLEAREAFDKAAVVNGIKSLTSKEIEISKTDNKLLLQFSYQREIHLAGPAFLTLKYSGQSK